MDSEKKIIVRLVEEPDKLRYLPFFKECFEAEYSQMLNKLSPDRDYEFTSEFLETILPNNDHQMFEGVLPDNAVVATGVGVERHERFYIWGMYVLPKYQRLGLGQRIIKSFSTIASPKSVLEVQVLRDSYKAQQFYRRLGFVTFQSSEEEVFPNVRMLTDFMECASTSISV
jgi:GNAT superfamily N-acetyltransferase